jgi:hypothetical protein
MFSNITGPQFLLIIGGFIVTYYAVLALFFRRKLIAGLTPTKGRTLQATQAGPNTTRHELIARPVEVDGEPLEILLEKQPDDDDTLEILQDDDYILVKEAEKVVEQIQVEINHIVSNPPNPEEVFSKINAIVRQYRIFENTEYFEPINRFVALAVQRDCNIQWTEKDIMALWK